MEKQTVIFACKAHVEMAIDDFVNEKEAAPEITNINKIKCNYCEEDAEYEIKE